MYKFSAFVLALAVLAGGALNASAQKKPLDHDVYDSWESVSALAISPDGNIVSFEVRPQDGDGRLVLRNLTTGAELEIERGTAFDMPLDAKYGVLKIKAPHAETRQAKIDKKKNDEMPRDSVAYVDLGTMTLTKLGEAKSIKTGYSAAPYIYVTPYAGKNDKKKEGPGRDRGGDRGRGGDEVSNLLVLNTSTGAVDTLRDIYSFTVSKSGEKIAAVIKKATSDSTSVKAVRYYDFPAKLSAEVSEGKEDYASLAFNDGDDKLVFTATDEEEKTHGTPSYGIYLSEEKTLRKATRTTPAQKTVETRELVAQNVEGLPEGWVVSKESRPRFSNKSSRLILSLHEYVPAKDTTVIDFESASLDIWVWDSMELPPMSKASRRPSGLLAVVNLQNPTLIPVQVNARDRITIPDGGDGDFAVDFETGKYDFNNLWEPVSTADYTLVDLNTGSRTTLLEGFEGSVHVSPTGKWLLSFNHEDGNWYCMSTLGGEFVNLTGQTGLPFYDEEDDHPMPYTPNSRPAWSEDDDYVFLNDRYDVWRFSPDGKSAVNLTAGKGRQTHTQYSVENPVFENNPYLYTNPMSCPKAGKMLLRAYGEDDCRNGYAFVNSNKAGLLSSFTAESSFRSIRKATDAERYVYLRGDFKHPMDAYVASAPMKDEIRLSEINPQQADYLWGDVQLVHWTAYDGTPLKGMLYTPENLDENGSYPMIVYFYEKYSDALYTYYSPAPIRSIINIPFYVSRGYVVFVPDIVYEPGHPGKSAINSICAGAEAMCEQFPFIDKTRMAIQGQSWGGYQVAYLVTQTDMFAAAGAGAPVGNMTSAYGGIRWESGNSRIPQYEYGQSRIGKDLWEDGGLDLYIENSPVFFADNVTTPVLIMHNDADGAVPWYQGIEFFMSLRRQGKPAWLLQYNDEQHNLVERRNCKDLTIRMQQFFDYYLMGAPMPVWMKSGIPYARKGNYFGYETAE